MFDVLRPWRPVRRLVGEAGFALTSMPVGIVTFVAIVTLASITAGLLITFVLGVPLAWLLFVVSRGLARLQRSRVTALTGVAIGDAVPPLTAPGWLSRLRERVGEGARWRELAHHLAALPVGVLGGTLTVAAWGGSVAMVAMPAVVHAMPGDSAKFYFFELHPGIGAWAAALVGAAGLVVIAPWVTRGVANVELAMARSLLGPTAEQRNAVQMKRLETSRSAAVDSAEEERRRIERDLHDGAQQRLVALAANLGAAREKLDGTAPDEGRALVAVAHEDAKAALKELRDLVRGIHPVILEDRGLDAALSAVVARAPIPVTLDVAVANRPPAAIESAAYFVVNEALTNVARHAKATRAHVSIARAGDRLVVEVRDDGVGGADVRAGTGLQGLRDRIAGMGGSMYVISPLGGPTTISVELPCGS
ncbi:MAG: sensor histidine kinase [Ilumatobacteraceae bacterium]